MSRSVTAAPGRIALIHAAARRGARDALCAALLLATCAAQAESPPRIGTGVVYDGPPMGQSPAAGDPLALPDDAGLDDLIRFAMQHSPVVGAAFQRWRAAMERVPQARALPDPRLGLGIVLDQVDRDAEYMGERYSISQMFPWFGTLGLREDIAMQDAEAEARRYEVARLELVERVTAAWLEYAWIYQAAETARENRALMLRLESVARALYRTGAVSQADVNRAQVELGRVDDQWRSMQDMIGPAGAVLNAALGRPAHAPLPAGPRAPSRQVFAALPDQDDEAWLALARQESPELAASRHAVERERQAVALARKAYYPDITLGVEYARDGSARMAAMDGGGSDMLAGMISISVPIRRSRYDAGLSEARARLAAAGHLVRDREYTLEAELKGALFAYREGERRQRLYGGTLVPKARQSLASTEAAYRAGEAGFSDLIDAQRVLLEFELAHERAAADRGQARARIDALVGTLQEGQTP